MRCVLFLWMAMAIVGCKSLADIERPCDLFGEPCELEAHDCFMITVDNPEEDLRSGDAMCLEPGTLTQGEACSFLNECAAGFGCVLGRTSSDVTLVCTQYCDASSMGGPTCPSGFDCRQINTTYNNTGGVPDAIGFCTPDGWDQ